MMELKNVSGEVKNCNTCLSSIRITGKMCPKWCDNYEHYRPKLADENPKVEKVKKYKYVCKKCGIKCKFITVDGETLSNHLSHCPINGDAKWKLKGGNVNENNRI